MTTPPNTRPFNLQDFLAGKPIVCRNGFVPTDAHYFEKAVTPNSRIVFTNEIGHLIFSSSNTGCSTYSQSDNGEYDLFHPCEQKEGWVNLYRLEDGTVYVDRGHPKVHESIEEAKKFIIGSLYLTTVKITWYE